MALSFASYGIGVGVLATTVAVSSLVVRWPTLSAWWKRFLVAQRSEYDVAVIFAEFLSAVTNQRDRRQLYPVLLSFLADLSHSECASVLTRNGDPQRFLLRESLGVRPGSFKLGDVSTFFAALRKRGHAVTREQLIHDPALAELKTVGLQYCVQFHAEVCIPCFLGDELQAVINLGPRREGAFDQRLLDVLQLLSGQAALAIHNARLYENLHQQHAELKELGELKAHLLANVSHELRTPLSSIIGLTDHLMENDAELSEAERKKFVGMVNGSGQRLLGTVTSLLDLARLETDRTNLHIQRLNIARLVDDVSTEVQCSPTTEFVNGLGTPPVVYGDASWIKCLLEHVIGNAAKYTPHGKIWIDAARAGDMLELTVHDTGIGIAKEKQRAIFKEFRQASNGTDRMYEGTGVGLNIASKIIQLHGGRIWLDSEPGVGSHVHFTLPLRPA